MTPFVVGKTYIRRDIHRQFRGQQYGGISTPASVPYILLFTGEQGEQYGYNDGFQNDGTFWYTGEGQIGDMKMIRGNLAIRNHQSNRKDLHLFEYVDRRSVRYVGQAHYLGDHPQVAPDRLGNPRKVIVFELSVDVDSGGAAELKPEPPSRTFPELWRQSLSELRDRALAAANQDRGPKAQSTNVHYRSEVIKVYVLRRANGICEGCGQPAPFQTPKKQPYLEPHHLRRISDKGPDHPAWVIALCPNCHRRVHYGVDGHDYNNALRSHLAEIEPTQQLAS